MVGSGPNAASFAGGLCAPCRQSTLPHMQGVVRGFLELSSGPLSGTHGVSGMRHLAFEVARLGSLIGVVTLLVLGRQADAGGRAGQAGAGVTHGGAQAGRR